MLEARVQAEILRRHFGDRWGQRRIAQELGISRKAVRRVIQCRRVSEGRRQAERPSLLDPFKPEIRRYLEQDPQRSGVNIFQRLREQGYEGGMSILWEYLKRARPEEPKEAYLPLEFGPGEAAQVDWGEFGDVWNQGQKVHAFVMVLCWSRMLYVEFTLRETQGALLRCYERALRYFGGLCREYWHDNMPTVVAEREGTLVRPAAKFDAYAGFHGFRPVFCGVGRGNEKGRVEDGVKLVRHQFWPGREFKDLGDMNEQAFEWRDLWANGRIHRSTGKVPRLMWEQERGYLRPLRADPYDTDEIRSCKVLPSFRVRFESNTYTVPWTLVERTVTLRADDEEVRIFYGSRRVCAHRRCYGRGQDIRNPRHEEGLREFKGEASRSWQEQTIRSWGPSCGRYLELIGRTSRSLRHELGALLVLGTVWGHPEVEEAAGELLSRGLVGADLLERSLRSRGQEAAAPPPLSLRDPKLEFMPPAADLGSYDQFLLNPGEAG
jgi:transposase